MSRQSADLLRQSHTRMNVHKKASVPHPLPRTRGVISLPPTLHTSIMNGLVSSPNSIANIQRALAGSLGQSGWNGELDSYLRGEFEKAASANEKGEVRVDEAEVMEKVLQMVMRGFTVEGGEERGRLGVGEGAVEQMVRAVKEELEKCCVVVDGEAWEG